MVVKETWLSPLNLNLVKVKYIYIQDWMRFLHVKINYLTKIQIKIISEYAREVMGTGEVSVVQHV